MTETLWAIIPAAGYGTRASLQEPKQFASIAGRTLLEWTAGKVLSLREVEGAVIPVPREFENDRRLTQIIKSLASNQAKPVVVVPGAGTRQESVFLALNEVFREAPWVMVHDASRPFFSPDLFKRVFEAAKNASAAICGINVDDTVKSVLSPGGQGHSFVGTTLSRDGVVLVQTPQIFRHSLLRQAHEIARQDGFIGTDDSQLVERLGHKVAVVQGERTNFKITYPEDFCLASAFLKEKDSGIPEFSSLPAGYRPGTSSESSRSGRFRRTRYSKRSKILVTGFGFDVHPLVSGRKCILGGVEIPFDKGLSGHSDADVLCHAIADAILGALGMGDIGKWFPPGCPESKDARSLDFLKVIQSHVRSISQIVHLDCTLVAQAPRLNLHMNNMKDNIAGALSISGDRVSVKATSPETLGSLGRGEGIAAFCTATVLKKGRV
ncbi:MAG: 2-C-methyl-D-erythritol 4-phosphate cytidylyltransferase [Bacillota bacterium]